MCPMKHHCATTEFTTDKPIKNILFLHICQTAFVSANLLYNVPSDFVNQGLMSVFNSHLFIFGMFHTLFVLVRQEGAYLRLAV